MFGMVEKSASKGPRRPGAWASRLETELARAEASLAAGDSEDAERRAKAVVLMARAARDLAELYALDRQAPEEDDVDALRAELRARLARFAAGQGEGDFFGDAAGGLAADMAR